MYLRSQGVVVVLPRETGLDVAARLKGLASLDDLFSKIRQKTWRGKLRENEAAYVEVLGVNLAMLRHVEVLLGHEHTLYQTKSVKLSFRG